MLSIFKKSMAFICQMFLFLYFVGKNCYLVLEFMKHITNSSAHERWFTFTIIRAFLSIKEAGIEDTSDCSTLLLFFC